MALGWLFLSRKQEFLPLKDAPPETIVVAFQIQKRKKKKKENCDSGYGYGYGLDLLSWTVNVAARPHDSILALVVNEDGKAWGSLQSSDNHEVCSTNHHLTPIREICRLKEVQLDISFATGGSLEKLLIEHAFSSKARMIVVSSSSRYSLWWYAQKRGSYLARQAPMGCSVVVVKDFKVLYYKENSTTGAKRGLFSREASSKSYPVQSVELDDIESNSPRGVLEGRSASLSSESDGISTSSSSLSSILSHSLSYKHLLSSTSSSYLSYNEGEDDCCDNGIAHQSSNCMGSRKSTSRKGNMVFQLKRLTSSRFSFKSYAGLEGQTIPYMPPIDSNAKRNSWKCFTFDEIFLATNGFTAENLVGKGGYADVYRGSLPNGQLIAVKRLKESEKGEAREIGFLKELGILGHVSHPNTTPLIGFCVESEFHLIFSLSQRGNLSSLLHGSNETEVLDWSVRLKVAMGTARGLHYLHTGCPRRIVHRDIKSSNILLSEDFEPQISDFGLAKWLPEQSTHLTVTNVEGTFGYLAPEYFMHGIVDEKTDVFSFGVLLLELITGRQPIDTKQQSLVMQVKPLLDSGKTAELVDPRLEGVFEPQKMQCMMKAARLCVHQSPTCRPFMSQVLELMSGDGIMCLDPVDLRTLPLSYFLYCDDSEVARICDEEYNFNSYLHDLKRHKEIALQF